MPEMKRNFTGGKMNKDLDERVVPNGQYRDAMNIQVSTSDGDDIGTVQNILGNVVIQANFSIDPSAICVGSIADEKNDKIYYFTKSSAKDRIIEYDSKTNYITLVLVQSSGFFPLDDNGDTITITGINIIDDLLFWTDNKSEPKKINIQRCKSGTQASGTVNTKLINNFQSINVDIKEEHLTVIKKAPRKALKLDLSQTSDDADEDAYIFKEKLVRFSYRYKYLDGEYSPFAPFSNIAFSPGSFEYKPKKGYNVGMSNRIVELGLEEFITPDLPKDVEAIDLLIKMEVSPTVYIVDTIRKNDTVPSGATNNPWNLNKYTITSDGSIKGAIPSNQMLRPWDNVPKRALGQEITGNRLVYGNYTQGYSLLNSSGSNYRPEFGVDIDGQSNGTANEPLKSIKSLRDYQLGVVFSDEYGRETPVISNQSGIVHVPKVNADKGNVLNISFLEQEHPEDMKYFKFFIKENSSQYYNVAMDRYYIDDDENVWLSFPSSDRNKIDLDTVLMLKKSIDSDDLVEEKANYKVLAIENQAPDFIKTEKFVIEQQSHVASTTSTDSSGNLIVSGLNKDIFGSGIAAAPLEGYRNFKMNYLPFSSNSGSDLHKITTGALYIEFGLLSSSQVSERYRISKITCDVDLEGVEIEDANYSITLKTPLTDDVNFITDDINGVTSSKILDLAEVTIYKYSVIQGSIFEGRFFVKISAPSNFTSIIQPAPTAVPTQYNVVGSKKLYFMNSDHNDRTADGLGGHDSSVTGLDDGAYDTEQTVVNPDGQIWDDFSKFAVYFRNYQYANDSATLKNLSDTPIDVGQYRFGSLSDEDWKTEFLNYTSSGDDNWKNGYAAITPTKVADGRQKENEVWFIDNGPYVSQRNTNNSMHWSWTREPANKPSSGITEESGYWTMDVGHGGISGGVVGSDHTPNFFGIGEEGNAFYKDNATLDFVDRLSPATQFRFKEDPNETVYTMLPVDSYSGSSGIGVYHNSRKIRYAGNHEYTGDLDSSDLMVNGNFDDVPGGWTITQTSGDMALGAWELVALNATTGSGGYARMVGEDASDPVHGYLEISGVDILEGRKYSITYSLSAKLPGNTSAKPKGELILANHTTDDSTYNSPSGSNNVILLGKSGSGADYGWDSGTYTTKWVQGPSNTGKIKLWRSNDMAGIQIDNIEVRLQSGKVLYDYEVPELSPNFTNNWMMKMTPEIAWNPAQAILGPIDGGYNIEVAAASGTPYANNTSNINDYYIILAAGIGADQGGFGNVAITKGLIVTHFNNAAVPGQYLLVKKVEEISGKWNVYLTGYSQLLRISDTIDPSAGQTIRFQQPTMNGYSENSTNRINTNSTNFSIANPGLQAVGYNVQFVRKTFTTPEMPEDPAIFETEPKEQTNLDIYYEASGLNPILLSASNINTVLPIGSTVTLTDPAHAGVEPATITAYPGGGNVITLQYPATNPSTFSSVLTTGERFKIEDDNGDFIRYVSIEYGGVPTNQGSSQATSGDVTIDTRLWKEEQPLDWHNCYSFGNGVESNRIKDAFNLQYIANGVKVSTTLDTEYKEENRKYGLIYSGLYNSNSGVNNLNQFIAAEKITKDINPIYGSIQKLHSRDTDLITLCEDKCLRILVSKDALYNADGNAQLLATAGVLGQTIPFSGEFGISKNPESFASESYRVYFTDKQRGAVMRLSKDGLTSISDHGMKDWFRDNLKLSTKLIGSYDDKKDEYNITLPDITKTVSFQENVRGWVSFKSFIPENAISCANEYYSFNEGKLYQHHNESVDRNTFYGAGKFVASSFTVILNDAPGSVKTFKTLNYEGSKSKIDIITSGAGNVGEYDTFDIGNVTPTGTVSSGDYYNLDTVKGWYVEKIQTNKEVGSLNEFIEKEGKWFNYIKGSINYVPNDSGNIVAWGDNADSSFQGIGRMTAIATGSNEGCTDCGSYWESVNLGQYCNDTTFGAGDGSSAGDEGSFNYNPNAGLEDGSCEDVVYGCMTPGSVNYDSSANVAAWCNIPGCVCTGSYNWYPYGWNLSMYIEFPNETNCDSAATVDNGTCTPGIVGCMDSTMFNYEAGFTQDCMSGNSTWNDICCEPFAYGCTAVNSTNYDPTANTDNGSCIPIVVGCSVGSATNYDSNVNTNDPLLCTYAGCMDPLANNLTNSYPTHNVTSDDGSCEYDGCTDSTADNYGCWYDSGTETCGGTLPNGVTNVTVDDGSCAYSGCMDPAACNYDVNATIDDGSCADVYGCMDANASNQDPSATCDDGSCTYNGCMDPNACNFDQYAVTDDGSCGYCGNATADNYGLGVCTCTFCNAVTNFQVTQDLGDTYVGLSWEYNPSAAFDSASTAYIVEYRVSGTNTWLSVFAADDQNDSFWVTGLIPSESYQFRVSANCTNTTSTASSILSNTTLAEIFPGCMDATACNFDDVATVDDNSCEFLTCAGCSDPLYVEYCGDCWDYTNQIVVSSGGSAWQISDQTQCVTLIVNGCTDDTMFNYNVAANVDDGSCVAIALGCIDPTVSNHDSNANTDDGSCCIDGCTDVNATDHDPAATCDDGSCTYPGCIDPTMANYDPNANLDDGTCIAVGTAIPDQEFEQRLIDLGYDDVLDGFVPTSNINTITNLAVTSYPNQNYANKITDLTGIEDFVALTQINVNYNSLATIDLSSLSNLTNLHALNSGITSLSFHDGVNAYNPGLYDVKINFNNMSTIDLSKNTSLVVLQIKGSFLTSLDLSQNHQLTTLQCSGTAGGRNIITNLNVKNGNNTNFVLFNAHSQPNLYCIDVDDATYSTANWTDIDAHTQFSTDCSSEIFGCMDASAANYGSTATIDNGTCTY